MSESEIEFEYDEDNESDFSFDSDNDRTNSNVKAITYESWTLPNFIQTFFINKVKSLHERQLPQCSLDDLLIMLQFKSWEIDDVINDYYDDENKLLKVCGLVKNPNNKISNEKNFNCLICCETYENAEAYSLTCAHKFCISCYNEYIQNSLHKGTLIKCMDPDCSLTIPHKDIENILSINEDSKQILKIERPLNVNSLLTYNAKIYIETHNLNMKWCPAPDCNNLTELLNGYEKVSGNDNDISHIPIVRCPDNHEFCYECQFENHLPCPCWIVKIWIKKCQDDSETANWIQANTQTCPKCNTSIEKNGGCNHMICSKCRYEFCWICLNDWKQHGTSYYKCNRFDPNQNNETEKVKQSKRLSLQRYLHFYKRFTVHESSMKADKKTLDKVNEKMRLYMEKMSASNNQKNLSWIDIQYLHDAIRSLTNGRKTLKWTYCFAFYLGNSNFSEIFEQNQDFLNKTVEDLSEIFEKINHKKNKDRIDIISQYKSQMINLSKVISMRQQTLIKGAETELNQSLLYFET